MTNASKTIQDLFDLQIEDLKQHIDNLSIFDDVEEYKDQLQLLQEKLDQLGELVVIRDSLGIEESRYLNIREEAGAVGELDLDSVQTVNIAKVYVFERKLRGGIIHLDDGDYYIAEKMVRDMNILHGAKVTITNDYVHNGKRRYSFHILENGVTDRPGRVQLSDCTVINKSGALFAYYKETNQSYVLDNEDVDSYKISPGDTVDLAYYENNPAKINVIHRHDRPLIKRYGNVLVAVDSVDIDVEALKRRVEDHGYSVEHVEPCYGTEMLYTLNKYATVYEAFFVDPSLTEAMNTTINIFRGARRDVRFHEYLQEGVYL